MRLLFVLPGLHRYHRGAEVAFLSIANELSALGHNITLMGSGDVKAPTRYDYIRIPSLRRELFEHAPSFPVFRNECIYEELTFIPGLLYRYQPARYDATITCSFPFTNLFLRRPKLVGPRPRHIFITQNGDWPAFSGDSEYRLFSCDGLVCTNPDFYQRNKNTWPSVLIPNGVDVERFAPGHSRRADFGLPDGKLIILMVSALIESKRVELGVHAASLLPNAHLVVAGDGPLRERISQIAREKLSGRFTLLTVPASRMSDLYRSSDLLLHLSREEAFGNVYVEAMATGLPIVAPDTERVRWIVGHDEFLLTEEAPMAIAKAIELSQNSDRQAVRAARAQQFSWKTIGRSYEDFIKQIVSNEFRTADGST
jgi:glycosyltransferase involved in cell wall biosynthesis